MPPIRSADLAHVMTLAARDTVIAPSDIAGDLGKLDYVPDAGDWVRTGPDEPIVGRDVAIAATHHRSADLAALIAGFLVRCRAHSIVYDQF